MRPVLVALFFLLPAGCRSVVGAGVSVPEGSPADAFAVMATADRLAARDLWPGFDARRIPVAIYDGERTLLFRHPGPPAGFEAVAGSDVVWAYAGRYPSVTSNSSTEIGGVVTATLMPAGGSSSLVRRAGTVIHESFHVYQRRHHPAWQANEVELFTYPLDDPELLALRRLEAEALRRALANGRHDRDACWGELALAFRRERFGRMPAGAVAYERGNELLEGLASYVESRATLAEAGNGGGACEVTPAQRDSVGAAAASDVDQLRTRLARQRITFLEQPGWRLVVEAPSGPLFPQGFDPLNVHTVSPGEVLHTRWIKLGNAAGTAEVLGRSALTVASGAHPLFNGVRQLTVTGLADEPAVTEANGTVTVRAEGVTAELRGAVVERSGQTVIVRLGRGQ
jgi:hypothetical protein